MTDARNTVSLAPLRMHRRWMILLCTLLTAMAFIAPAVRAQDDQGGAQAGGDSEAVPSVTLEAVNTRIAELEQVTTRSEEQEKILQQLQQARDWLTRLDRSRQQTQTFTTASAAAPTELADWKARPRPTPQEALPDSYNEATAESIAPELEAARTELAARRQARQDLATTATFRDERLRQIPNDTQTARQRITEIATQLAAPSPADEAASVTQTRKQALAAERLYLQAHLAELEQERINYNARRELLRERTLFKEQEVLAQERLVALLEAKYNALLQQAAERERQRAEREAAAARNAHPIIQKILADNERYAAERAAIRSRMTELTTVRNQAEELLSNLQNRLKDDLERVEQVGLSEAIGMRLRTQRSRLPSLRVAERQLNAYELELNRAQLERGRLEDVQLRLVGLDSELDQRFDQTDAPLPSNPDELERLREAARTALREQSETHLSQLIEAYDNHINTILIPLLEHETGIVRITREYRDFIDGRVLWIQSTRPIGLTDLQGMIDSVAWMTNARTWNALLTSVKNHTTSKPILPGLGLLIFLALLVTRSRMTAFINRAADRAGRITTNFVGDTLTVAALTFLLAATWPWLIVVVARQAGAVLGEVSFADNLANGLTRLAMSWFAAGLLMQICRRNGLADAHFRWRPTTIRLLKRHLRWAVPLLLPLAFLTGLTAGTEAEAYRNSLGRAGFILSAVVLAAFTYFIMHPSHGVPGKYMKEHPNSWLSRLRWMWFWLLTLLPIALAVTSAMGYHYTAVELRERLILTVELILILVIINGLFVRWIFLTQRHLAYEQSRKRRMATLKALREKTSAQPKEQTQEASEYERKKAELEREDAADQTLTLDVDQISAQARQLLRTVVTFATIIGFALIWANVFPALSILREVELWTVTSTITADGTLTPVDVQNAITLREVAVSLLILLITIVVTRNIPGLLEVAVLQKLPFSAGGRYAIRTITQYVLAIIGMIVAFDAIGIGWSNVQFLAAAVTVGLGFGLQEIFANFVSGIIILFERPIRVGDVITVGNTSGTVSRIRMRATTITDWDRKELIIPNKEFVTGQIVNWSLSDSVLRVIIPVGVSYGADTDLAREMLLEVARADERILRDPPPRALFLGFGDSTLNFELRVFIPHIDYFLNVRDELHHAIIKRFRERDIEIAFPQRDLHIRSVAPEISLSSVPRVERDGS